MSDEAAYEFVDTNVLVYAHDRSAGAKHQRAQTLLNDLWESQRGCLSLQVLQEFYVTITRKVPQPLSAQTAGLLIDDLRTWRVHLPDVDDLLAAIALQERYQLSFWDALIIRSALQLGCDVVWSEDLNPGQRYEGLRVVNPFTPEGVED